MAEPELVDVPVRDRSQVRLVRSVMRANAALREAHKSFMQVHDTNLSEFDFLAALGNTGGLRMSDLAEAMITTPSNVTRLCAAMEKKGLAVRERSAQSDREVIARLTPEGQARFEALFPLVVRFTTDLVDRLLPASDQASVAGALERLIAELTRG
jgi:MarR family 2-MHQ and catechol resistance regulon transcriptional repressor